MIVVSPDVGGVVRARAFAKRLDDAELAIIDKRRPRPNESKVMNIIGEVEGKTCVLIDDMVDTAGTLCLAAQALKDEGALKVVAYITHAVLSGGAVERIAKSALDELVVTDTIPLCAGGAGVRAHPPAVGGGAAGRDDSPHPRRGVGELAVRRLRREKIFGRAGIGRDPARVGSNYWRIRNAYFIQVRRGRPRDDQGKGASRRLRHAGKVPAILYGAHEDAAERWCSISRTC